MGLKDIPDVLCLEPETLDGVSSAGKNRVLNMRCRNSSCSTMPYVVKLTSGTEFGKHVCAKELFCALLGRSFELPIPEPATILITNEFSQIFGNNLSDLKTRLEASKGVNFGSKKIVQNALIFESVPRDQYQIAANIFAFDTLIQNSDRTKLNPNTLMTVNGMAIIDHECAFPFTDTNFFGTEIDAWDYENFRDEIVRKHAYFPSVRREKLCFDDFAEKLDELSGEKLDTIISKLPNEWRTEKMDRIRNYLLRARAQTGKFVERLREVLSK